MRCRSAATGSAGPDAATTGAREEPAVPIRPRIEGLRLLVVEDEPSLVAYYEDVFALAGDEDREPAIQAFLDLQARAPGAMR